MIPVLYLEQEKPYLCGIPDCGCRFSTYKLLSFHAKVHSGHSLEEVLNNQLIIPEGRVHCPVVGCEVSFSIYVYSSLVQIISHSLPTLC